MKISGLERNMMLCMKQHCVENEPTGLLVLTLLDFFSTLYGQTLNVGRVMTPTLAMAVMREAAISAFKPELFYTVQIDWMVLRLQANASKPRQQPKLSNKAVRWQSFRKLNVRRKQKSRLRSMT